jgi:hypothetical protein
VSEEEVYEMNGMNGRTFRVIVRLIHEIGLFDK